MTRHVALLRGINVGGKHRLPMARLRELFEAAGATNVRTYIQSGNVALDATAANAKRIPAAVGQAIEDEFGFSCPVLTRTAREMRAVVEGNPWPRADEALLHVGFLADRPTKAAVASLDPDRSPPDEFVVIGREIYLHCPGGIARTKLGNAYLDKQLNTAVTVRNWRTTRALLELASE